MTDLNLLAARRIEVMRLRRRLAILKGVIVGLIIITVILGGFWLKDIIQIGRIEIPRTKKSIERLQVEAREVDRLRGLITEMKPRIDLLDQALESEKGWRNLLVALSYRIPPNVWLESVVSRRTQIAKGGATEEAGGKVKRPPATEVQTLTLMGNAVESLRGDPREREALESLGSFILELNRTNLFAKPVVLLRVSRSAQDVITFTIQGELKKPIGLGGR